MSASALTHPTHSGKHANKADAALEALIDFPTLFARQLARTPEHVSMVFEDKSFSYKDLDELSEQFKISILWQKSQASLNDPEMCVGICVDKSPEAIAAMLGVLKAGAAFVPLDPEYPIDRIAFMIEDAGISTVIAQPNHQQKIAPFLAEQLINKDSGIHWISSEYPAKNAESESMLSSMIVDIKPSDLAYIMYTSGSTGKPKGVQIEHAALATYCYADIERYEVTETDRTLQFSTINFDIAIEEIFPPLLVGGSVVIRPAKRSEKLNELSAIINDHQITAVHIATAYWHEWVDLMIASEDKIPPSLRLMVVTGEKVSTTHYQNWKTLCQLSGLDVLWCNAYGPTEATVSASVFIPSDDFQGDNMPIGKPLKRYTALIVDEDYIELPVGETGQLLIGGPALARGYLNRPELNDEVFIDTVGAIDKKGKHQYQVERMYKTGDLARWLPSGDIEFAGRIDHLPPYMVPARYIFVASFPKTTNGKIDRKALPDPSASQTVVDADKVMSRIIGDLKLDSIELRKRLPQLQSVYLASGEERLFAMHYRPPAEQKSQSHAVLICHPLGHEYSRAYRNLQQFALHLSQAGFDTFRFDYSGTGNSSGNTETTLASDYIADIKASADYIREQSQCQKLSVIGLRMGAPLAVSAAITDLENLILWDPIVRGANYIELLQGFHDKALSKLERFREIRTPSDLPQLYGYAMNQVQRDSIMNLTMPHLEAVGMDKGLAKTQTMVTSSAYQRNEPGRSDLIDNCQHHATQDEIQWHDRLHADSACLCNA